MDKDKIFARWQFFILRRAFHICNKIFLYWLGSQRNVLRIQEQMRLVLAFLIFPVVHWKYPGGQATGSRFKLPVFFWKKSEGVDLWSGVYVADHSDCFGLLWLNFKVCEKNIYFFEKKECFYGKRDDERRVNSKAEWQRISLRILSNNNNNSDAYSLFTLCSERFPKPWDSNSLSPHRMPSTLAELSSWWPQGQECWPRALGSSAVSEILDFVQGIFPGKALAPSWYFHQRCVKIHPGWQRGRAGGRKHIWFCDHMWL